MTISILEQPTFDLGQVSIVNFGVDTIYLKSSDVFRFDGVIANIINRSRVLRPEKEESKWIESVIAATVDAGFVGHLSWKAKLTSYGEKQLLQNPVDTQKILSKLCSSSSQLQMHISPAGNYYSGSNQTDLQPDVVFEAR